jgi:hypothetical protein
MLLQTLREISIQLADATAAIAYSTFGSLGILVVMELVLSWRILLNRPVNSSVFGMRTDEDEIVLQELS